ncbi:nuclease-related domain-containing protein [Planococcus sp. N028]|uniref:Nuclease-related domain-containing protein n=1 Tax=Planococcus shixiaomingii TaxID=3058393 RepID=A0ABT8N2J2_9BACL|nr:nuclease-related domain-containing protein [Planococcus sp. N028]
MLLERLESNHPQRQFLEQQLHWRAAGKRGESRLQKKFNEFYQEEEFHILWNVNLKIGNWPVQMDGLLLTDRCVVIVESKNINGQLHFDEKTGEFFRFNSEGEKTVLEDPRIQLNKNVRFLTQFFKLNKITLPVSGLVVFTAKDCEFISKPHRASLCKTYQMTESLIKILQAFPPGAANLKLSKIKKMILAADTPYRQTPLCTYYFINPKDLKSGVFCQNCKTLTMQRDKRNWLCSNCGIYDASAHLLAIREYLTFVETKLTNQKLRDFCGFESRAVATRLLAKLDLERLGESKAFSYHLRE